MNIKKMKAYYVFSYSFVYASLYWVLHALFEDFKTTWILYPIAFISMVLVLSITLLFAKIYLRVKVNDIILKDDEVIFITRKKGYIFNIDQCTKIIETKKYCIFEFQKIKFGLKAYGDFIDKIHIESDKFFNAKYIIKDKKN